MHSTQNKDDEAKMLPGVPASSPLRPRRGEPVILVFSQRPAARCAADASSSDRDVPPTIGELAVHLLARWSLPRMKLLAQGERGVSPAPASAHDPSWEDSDA